jgi:hypothetical protein
MMTKTFHYLILTGSYSSDDDTRIDKRTVCSALNDILREQNLEPIVSTAYDISRYSRPDMFSVVDVWNEMAPSVKSQIPARLRNALNVFVGVGDISAEMGLDDDDQKYKLSEKEIDESKVRGESSSQT